MITRFTRTITLPSGNTARGFNVRDLGNGRMQVAYVYTDRRRDHQVSRHFTAEFLNGRLESITARSARGGRVECFSTSVILAELLEMLNEFTAIQQDIAKSYRSEPAKVEAPVVESEQDDTDFLDTLKTVGGMVMINILITLATLGIVWYNL
jgi:hypothetical protein